jgi:hypothetical protein
MEERFLQYLLYTILIDIRARTSENGDNVSFGMCNLMHNVPISLANGTDSKEVYKEFLEKIELNGFQDWLKIRKEEFYSRFRNESNPNT